jgi:hypothetical protein
MTQSLAEPAPRSGRSAYARGAAFALFTAALLATQEPLSGPAAQKLGAVQFVLVNQIALTLATPFLLWDRDSRRDLRAIFTSPPGWKHLAALMAVGLMGLALYNLSLSRAHPVVISAVLNLSPFWAAMVARTLSGVAIPGGPATFAACLLLSFVGAITVAYSQAPSASLWEMLSKGSWYFALPVPVFTALSGSLVQVWFKERRESAAVSAALLFSAAVMIPACAIYLWWSGEGFSIDWKLAGLMMLGAVLASAVGRLF